MGLYEDQSHRQIPGWSPKKKKEKIHIHSLGSINVDLMTYTKAVSKIVRDCVPHDMQCKNLNDVDDFQGKLNGLD